MQTETNIWIEENQVLCCSSMCDGCLEKYKCKPIPQELVNLLLGVKHGQNND